VRVSPYPFSMSSARTLTTSVRRSARLVTWARAWRAGIVSYDDVADETERGEEHLVADAPDTWTDVPLREAVRMMSRLHPDEIRLVLPAPGDPRGLPGPGPFTAGALDVGEGVIAGSLGLVPQVRSHVSGSGDTFETVVWQAYPLPTAAGGAMSAGSANVAGGAPSAGSAVVLGGGEPTLAEADADLTATVAEATAALIRLDVTTWRPDIAGALAALRRPDNGTDLPPGFSPRARRLFARASVLDRVLALAAEVSPDAGVNGFEVQQREAALRPLKVACRRALVAACNSPLEG
jgi:hypothetical protein